MTVLRSAVCALGAVALLASGGPAAAEDARSGDPSAGEKVFNKCRPCHQIGEGARTLVGPELNGVIGRRSGSVPGYSYSEANKASGLVWDEPTFRRYIAHPQAVVPGTKMSFAGLDRERDIDNLVAYLRQFGADGAKR